MLTRLLVVVAGWVCLVLWAQRHLIYPRGIANRDRGGTTQLQRVQPLRRQTPQGPVEGWLLTGRGVSAENPGPAVIFAHGNGELIDDWVTLADAYQHTGVTTLMVEYRGYGRSAGKPSQQAITEDFVWFYDQLIGRRDVDPTRIVFHGRSLGGGVVCAVARARPPAALIIQSTFTSVTRLARRLLVPPFLILDPYNNLQTLQALTCPVLILHGKQDNIIPYWHSEMLHQAAANSHLVSYDCGHNDFPPDWAAFWNDIEHFLGKNRIITRQP